MRKTFLLLGLIILLPSFVSSLKDCDIGVFPSVINIDDDEREIELMLENNEGFKVHFYFVIREARGFNIAPGSFEVVKRLDLDAREGRPLTVSYVRPLMGHKAVDTVMSLEIDSDECERIVVPIEVRLSAFRGWTNVFDNAVSFLKESVHEGVPKVINLYIYGLFIFLFLGLFWNNLADGLKKKKLLQVLWNFMLMIFLTGVSGTIMVVLIRIIL